MEKQNAGLPQNDQEGVVGFVILNYNTYGLTIQCVESICRLREFENVRIIVVDNHSPDGSGEQLKKKYADHHQITVLCLSDNCGFSRANNVGVSELKKTGIPAFVIVTNSDTVFDQADTIPVIRQVYKETAFHVGGPDILNTTMGVHQSPIAEDPHSAAETFGRIKKQQDSLKKLKKEVWLHALYEKTADTSLYRFYASRKKKILSYPDLHWNLRQENVVLQGACLIFSKDYLRENDNTFWPETFFYAEEDILTCRCRKNGWTILYFPDVQVKHMVAGASSGANYEERMRFRYENQIRAEKIYLGFLGENEQNNT